MRPTTLFGKLFVGTTLLIAAVLGICAWLIVQQVDQFQATELTDHLRTQAEFIRFAVQDRFDPAHTAELNRLIRDWRGLRRNDPRITLVLRNGAVLAESDAESQTMAYHGDRPEIIEALKNGWGENIRYSATIAKNMKYVAIRVGPAEAPLGTVRVAMPLRQIMDRENAVKRLIWMIVILGCATAGVFALGLAHLWSSPLRRITAIAHSLSRGDLSARARAKGSDELALLARSLNEMRDHLTEQMNTIDHQRRTLESLLNQLREGVVVLGPDARILILNPSAAEMLGIDYDAMADAGGWVGFSAEQCVRHYELQQLLVEKLDADVREIRIQIERNNIGITLLARVSKLVLPTMPVSPQSTARAKYEEGRLLVLMDVTDLTRAAQVKMDFATNASHELRTPLSTIRAAIETLLNLDPASNTDKVRHFVGMIDRQSRRMEEMAVDLLDLSRIETSPSRFIPETLDLDELLADVRAKHSTRLSEKQLAWSIEKPPDLTHITASGDLLRIVLDNLVDNAIKFTNAGGRITLQCKSVTDDNSRPAIALTVADTGCGIPEEEQQRVFERFYQVERSRSGANRGTGLGLAIVRHAVAAMQSQVTLTSKPGEGTQVTITIPQ